MTGYDKTTLAKAVILAGLAGFVDATGFLASGGFFVSFMSGNSTRLGVGIAYNAQFALVATGLIVSFLAGVVCASLLGQKTKKKDNLGGLLLLLMALCLSCAALITDIAVDLPWAKALALGMIAFAMGMENLVFAIDEEVRFGLTYMTGTLVKIGQRLANAIAGGNRWEWMRHLALWAGLIFGGITGALAYPYLAFDTIWIAAILSAVLGLLFLKAPIANQRPVQPVTGPDR